MDDVGSILAGAVEWALVPLVLLILWGYGFASLPEQAETPHEKKAAHAGRWAGMVLFVLFVLWRRGRGDAFGETMPEYSFNLVGLLLIAAGTAAGFLFSRFIEILKGTRAFPFVPMVLVAFMSISIYTYFFIWESRSLILFLALGFALGTLLNRAFSTLRPSPPAGAGPA